MKNINTLIDDIYAVIEGSGGWNNTITQYFGEELQKLAVARFEERKDRNHLSLSMLGTPCDKKKWHKVNTPELGEPLDAQALGSFFYGDIIEVLVLALAKAAGHDVQGEQDDCEILGVPGHRDVVIDGVLVDVKSASSYGFKKFENHGLREDDPFGYLSQLSSYLYASQDDPLVDDKLGAAFLVVKKDRFKLCLDYYDLTEDMKNKEEEVQKAKDLVAGPMPTERIAPIPQSKTSKNTKLGVMCSYCEFRKSCWPEARTFIYSHGPEYLVDVKSEPRVSELIE